MKKLNKKRFLLWIIPVLLYFIFVLWYTDFKGPLTDKEINNFITIIKNRETMKNESSNKWITFFKKDTGRQFLMVNNIDMADNPPHVLGAKNGATAKELMNKYMEHMYKELFKRACHPVIFGNAVHEALDLYGIKNAKRWDHGALFRYRSRRSLMEIALNPHTKGRHRFKIAALEKTIAYPIETKLYFSDLRLLAGLIFFSLTSLFDLILFRRRD